MSKQKREEGRDIYEFIEKLETKKNIEIMEKELLIEKAHEG